MDEVPFDIPDSWEWVRVRNCTELFNGRAFKPSDWTVMGLPTRGVFESTLIPLPPFAEQIRIVEKLNVLFPIVDHYSSAYNNLNNLQSAFPEALKKSILQEAVQGKLVN